MLIKEIMALGISILFGLWVAHSPRAFHHRVRAFQVKILKEAARTDNWGDSSIFNYKDSKIKRVHAVERP
jgi:hypothetical protein